MVTSYLINVDLILKYYDTYLTDQENQDSDMAEEKTCLNVWY